MIEQINTISDVATFAKQLIEEGVSFHPDDDFDDYVELKTGEPFYSGKEAERRNHLMKQSFDVCEENAINIYDIMMEVSLTETGMNLLIPLP